MCLLIEPGCQDNRGSIDGMNRVNSKTTGLILVIGMTLLAACSDQQEPVVPTTNAEASQTVVEQEPAPVAIIGTTEIPYPIYPNGSKYRVGGENGMKIVLFETEDSFEAVDAFYQNASGKSSMSRLVAMNDYVRYTRNSDDNDPWATYLPGIVIHQFNDDEERVAVGAHQKALTNIIMSF